MENYMQYHVMGSVHQVRMKRECLPTKFHCQSDQKNTTSDAEQRMNLLEEFEKEMEERTAAAKRVEFGDNLPGCSGRWYLIISMKQHFHTLKIYID